MSVSDVIDRHITGLQDRLERFKAILTMVTDDPLLAFDLTKLLLSVGANGPVPGPEVAALPQQFGGGEEGENLGPVLKFFKAKKPEEWVRVKELVEGTGIAKPALYYLLNKQHPNLFEVNKRSRRNKSWRLKPGAGG